jgi:ATP-dependent DNA helicase RecG
MSTDSVVKIYDDRIEFFNPGKLPHGITIDKLLANDYISTPRNKLIANLFKEMGWIEKYGSGIQRIIESFKTARLPFPRFEEMSAGIRVTVLGEVTTDNVTDIRLNSIIDLIISNNMITTTELAIKLNVTRRTIARDIELLKTQSKLKRIDPDNGGYWQVNEQKTN